MQKIHMILWQVKVLYLALIPALALWGMHAFVTEANAALYFFGGMFCVALYLGMATELVGRLRTLLEQAFDLLLTLFLLVLALISVEGQFSFTAVWFYETAGIFLAIFVLMFAKQPLERLIKKILPQQRLYTPAGGFPGIGICLLFISMAAMFIGICWPIFPQLVPLYAVLLIFFNGAACIWRVLCSERQVGGEVAVLVGVFAYLVSLGFAVAF